MSYIPYVIIFVSAAICLIVFRAIDAVEARANVEAHKRFLEAAVKINEASEKVKATAADEARKAEKEAETERLKLERTKLLLHLSETDREAFNKLLDAALVEREGGNNTAYYNPVPLHFPTPVSYQPWAQWR